MKYYTRLLMVVIVSFTLSSCGTLNIFEKSDQEYFSEKFDQFSKTFEQGQFPFEIPANSKVDSFDIDYTNRNIDIHISDRFAQQPIREDKMEKIYRVVKDHFGERARKFNFTIHAMGYPLKSLIPNFYREKTGLDSSRIAERKERPKPVIRRVSAPYKITNGLNGKNIGLWHSHGWYYNNDKGRWEWQRPRLFQTVEDLLPMSFTIPYIIPMLENAGANVFVPRERDYQKNQVVIDNDTKSDRENSFYVEQSSEEVDGWSKGGTGFAVGEPPYPSGLNPFEQGTYRKIEADSVVSAKCSWIPEIPETGKYAVYISYRHDSDNVEGAHYSVFHEGGKTEFRINQKIGGGTWIYLGKFKFRKGYNEDNGVVLTNKSSTPGKHITADAVRFGGGMGVISRGGSASGRPKFVEAARYYLQYAGMPDTLTYNLHADTNDYNDDYKSRAEYLNYLQGAPFGPNRDRDVRGLGIPIDLSLAFHTDAGISQTDTTIGTLSIYSILDADSNKIYPNGVSRLANRDYADILQSELVSDIRKTMDTVWNRRSLRNSMYSEAFRPNVPAALLELLSHQNFLDMQFAQDPRFKFTASRAIYKSMLKFLSVQYGFDYVVQPLPVDHFRTEFIDSNSVRLEWKAVNDPLEPTAVPINYVVYMRVDSSGWDNGTLVDNNSFEVKIKKDKIYSFKVTAVNKGGESFPSEILSVCRVNNNKEPVIIVNGFDRIAPPQSVETNKFAGFMNLLDNGIEYKKNINFTGKQHNYRPYSNFNTNDSPGFGTSYANFETKIFAGNTFDYPFIHGQSLKEIGFSFVSASDESVENGMVNLVQYQFVDLILGEEKETHWQKPELDSIRGTQFKALPHGMMNILEDYLDIGGDLFISGAYVATDIFHSASSDSSIKKFAHEKLKMTWAANHASKEGILISISDIPYFDDSLKINTSYSEEIYSVESPDAIAPVQGGEVLLRYDENKFSAGVGFRDEYGVITFGFPFESIRGLESRNRLMKSIIEYFGI